MAMIAIFEWSINVRACRWACTRLARPPEASDTRSATCQPPASRARIHDLSANAASDSGKPLTTNGLGVLVDQTIVSWNRAHPWLRQLDRLQHLELAA